MKRTIYLSMLSAWMLLSATPADAQYEVKPFEHLSVSVNVGTPGYGVQAATPVNQYLSLRAGLIMNVFTYRYDYDGEIHFSNSGESYEYDVNIPMQAKVNMINGLLLADVFPFRNKRFHVTGGFYIGTSEIVKILAKAEVERPIEIGDVIIEPVNGHVAAHVKTNGIKPYIGLGFGSSVTKSKRIGFKVELGAMFHGRPQVAVTEGEVVNANEPNLDISNKINDFNKFLKNFTVYPVLNLQLNFRAF